MNSDQLHQLIRQSFEGRNRARLWFTMTELSHAWVNVFVERLKKIINEKWAYVVGHIAAWLGALLVLAVAGVVAVAVLNGIGVK